MSSPTSHLLCVGLATVDLVYRVGRIPGADEKAQASGVEIAAGGPATNAAVTAAALGAPVTLVTAVGRHPLGELIRADLRAHGVRLIDATPDSAAPPPVSAVTVLESTGERTIVSRNAGDLTVGVPPEGLPDAGLTLVDGHHPVLAVAAARAARRLLVDAGSWRPVFADILPLAEVVACSAAFRHPSAPGAGFRSGSDDDAHSCSGSDDDAGFWSGSDDDAGTAAAIGAPHVVVTHGPGPVRWFSGDRRGEVPVPPVDAVDTAGAGDAFHGALAVALTTSDLVGALTEAVRVAGVRVAHAGPRSWLTFL